VPEAAEDLNSMRRLWVHEILRVYGDRLIDDTDRNWLFTALCQVVEEKMSVPASELLSRFIEPGNTVSDYILNTLYSY